MKFVAILSTLALVSSVQASICSTAGLPTGMSAGSTYTLATTSNKLGALAEGKIRIIDSCKFEIINATFSKMNDGNTFVYGLIPNSQYKYYRISNDPVPANANGTIGPFTLLTSDVGAGVGVGISFGDIRGFRVTVTSPDITPISDANFNLPSDSSSTATTTSTSTSTPKASSVPSSASKLSATIVFAAAILGSVLLM